MFQANINTEARTTTTVTITEINTGTKIQKEKKKEEIKFDLGPIFVMPIINLSTILHCKGERRSIHSINIHVSVSHTSYAAYISNDIFGVLHSTS